ncbi:beta-mannosidase [Treponema brennaborense]|uniref:beta-mannosidase n=1 Tax=Treponema brennaborense (strain DSM 12168 / CIP 105900 / DD5/3) TaxID=906968 RepID=F4LJQ1_TREBD|nr:glycoside hydrolase family 2 protein [Treponema brennaborense]AEE17431.1 Beta-mannosidase [Treponema brennaborense DSM 12168]
MKATALDGTWKLRPRHPERVAAYTDAFTAHTEIPVPIPGDIHSALIHAGIIADPYFAKNELDVQWVGKEDWIISREIKIKKAFLSGQQFISFQFADTFFHVFINGREAGKGGNMFRSWRFNVSGLLHEGINTIEIMFESAERRAIESAARQPYPVPYSVYPVYSPHRNLVRKTQCHAGWDWGPCIMAFGVYESIRLEQTTKGFIDYVNTRYVRENDDWQVEVTTVYTAITDCTIPVSVKIEGPGIDTVITGTPVNVTVGENLIRHTVTVRRPELWWPAGCAPEDTAAVLTGSSALRENPLYTLTVTAYHAVKTKRIAFRTIDVVAEPDEHGKSMYFKVNGRPVFSKGANWIPCDALPSRQTPQKYEKLLRDLAAAHMNTVRVWGGGQYEKDIFYELCDRFGIMVWQDCMFACSLYPATPPFLRSVRAEIRHQVRRLKDHPSLALWCGNNEDVGALTWYPESIANRDRYIIDYDRLNEGVLADEIRQLDPDRAWWPSSPSAGPNDYSDNWHADGRGDMHYWSVWHEKKSFDAYLTIKPRFVSEFGYESFPSLSEVQTYAPRDQLNLTSPVMEFHQRSPGGNSIILENFSRYFRFPEGIKNMLYLSQVQQALAIKTAVEYWRSLRPICMGSIIWQLNDVWPVASWSSIEYSGKWKLLHYEAKKFFAPVAVVLYKKDGKISAHVLNDTEENLPVRVAIRFLTFDGKSAASQTGAHAGTQTDLSIDATVAPDSVLKVFECPETELPLAAHECFIYAELTYGDNRKTSNTLLPALPKECELRKACIKTAVKRLAPQIFEITLTTDKPAFFTALDTKKLGGTFSDNMLTLLPEAPVTVRFTADSEKLTQEKFEKALSVTTLTDTY